MNQLSKLLFLTFLLISFNSFAQRDYTVHFEGHHELFPQNASDAVKAKPSQDELVADYYIRYLQFEKIPSTSTRAKLELQGLKFLNYVSYGAYLTAIPMDFDLGSLNSASIRSIQEVHSNWKINPNLNHDTFEPWATHRGKLEIIVKIYPFADLDACSDRLKEQGYAILSKGKQGKTIKTRAPKADLAKISELAFVKHIELISPPGEPEDTRGRALHRSNMINSGSPMGKKYDGEGVAILVRDDGTIGPHIDIHGRTTDFAEDEGGIEHGDGVVGIFAGAGNLDPYMKGMASGATIFNTDYEADFEDITLGLHLTKNVKVTNSSYSNGCNDGYTTITQTVDKQIFENPTLLHVFSAGNSGNSDCDYGAGSGWGNITGGHKQAKNCIATANLGQDFVLDGSSSHGPAHDGRIKPDISANGLNHYSLEPDNTYGEFGGTSAAAPGIAGISAQLMHAHKELNGGAEAPSALIKTVLLNSANDLGNIGPDYTYGWGHVNAHRALSILEKKNYWTGQVEQDSVFTHTVNVPFGQTQARMMIYWAEMEAAENADRALINDLDLMVISPNGDTLMPWILDPTPNATALDAPATTGRDSLNNVEQVAILMPEPGDYTMIIRGYEVPMGAQEFYLVYETRDAKPTLTYPNGGEGLIPGETIRIHWDAEGSTGIASLQYSLDGGNSWQNMGGTNAANRFYDWQVPDVQSGNARMRITLSGQRDTTDFPFSFVARPTNVEITKVCPDSIFVSFEGVNDTLTHDVYLLGEKFMELRTTTTEYEVGIPISNATEEQWAAVAASHPNGLKGERTIAVQHSGGLKNCPQPYDATASNIVEPSGTLFTNCGPVSTDLKIRVENIGLNTMSGIMASYQLGDAAIVSEVVSDLNPGDFLEHTFAAQITVDTNATLPLKAWISFVDDNFKSNDTLKTDWTFATQFLDGPFQEDFQDLSPGTFPPAGWSIGNPDDALTWQSANVIGIADSLTDAAFMDFYSYSDRDQEDYLYIVPVDLTNFSAAAMKFDVAYTSYDVTGYDDALRIEAYPNCDLTATPIVLYEKQYPELATVEAQDNEWTPDSSADWRSELVNLSSISGKAIISFVSVNDYGNSLFLDNINVDNVVIAPTVANFTVSADTLCTNNIVTFSDLSTGDDLTYNWSFGTASQPSSASTAGPHNVLYINTSGTKEIQLIVGGAGGYDTLTYSIEILEKPTADFTVAQSSLTIELTDNSVGATSYLWDFGDGMTSTDPNPTYTYAAEGDYTVTLTTTNQCGDATATQMLITVGIKTLSDIYRVSASPNPTKGAFKVFFQSPKSETLDISLTDIQGRVIEKRTFDVSANVEHVLDMGNTDLVDGLYQVRLRTNEGEKTFQVIVQH